MPTVSPNARYTTTHPCPICSGYEKFERGKGRRCMGYLSTLKDGVAFCSREEYAGGAAPFDMAAQAYKHYLIGPCLCGITHNPAPEKTPMNNNSSTTSSNNNSGGWEFVTAWIYPGPDTGTQVRHARWVVRGSEKSYTWQHKNGSGKWVSGLPENYKPPLYRWSEVLTADPRLPVIIAEGEKACDACWNAGVPATTNPDGAGKWRAEDTAAILTLAAAAPGRKIIICPDNDPVGQKHADYIFSQLKGKIAVKVVRLPGLKEKGDPYDFFQDHDLKEFVKACQDVPYDEPPGPKLFVVLDYFDLLELPPLDWLLKPYFLRNYLCCLYGPTQTAKSLWMIDKALTLADQGAQVLYLAGENSYGYGNRLTAWYKFNEKEPNRNFKVIRTPVNFLDKDSVEQLQRTVDAIYPDKKPDLIVVDTLSKSFTGGSENDDVFMRRFAEACTRLIDAYHCAVTVVHHTPKSGDTPRGSGVILGDFDTLIEAGKSDQQGSSEKFVSFTCKKQKDAKEFPKELFRVVITGEGYDLDHSAVLERREDGEPDQQPGRHKPLTELALNILRVLGMAIHSDGMSPSKIMEFLQIDYKNNSSAKTTFFNNLNEVYERGYVDKRAGSRLGSTTYAINQAGRDLISDEEEI
jgi:KaiC/GvpD/RAD55 family RecA-like ATPase